MQEHLNDRAFSKTIIETIRRVLGSSSFCDRHKRRLQDFTRQRHFCFMSSVVFLLQKTVRSMQLHVHEFFDRLGEKGPPVTASAWSQARLKLSHTAFIELNQQAIWSRCTRRAAILGSNAGAVTGWWASTVR